MRGDASIRQFVSTVHRLLPGLAPSVGLFLVVSLIYETIKVIPLYLVKLLVDGLFGAEPGQKIIWIIGGLLFCLVILTAIEVGFWAYVGRVSSNQQKKMLERVFRKLMELPLSWHERQNTGSTISKLSKAANHIGQLVWSSTKT